MNGITSSSPVRKGPEYNRFFNFLSSILALTKRIYPEGHEAQGEHGAHEGHRDGHVDVSVQQQSPEVGSGASRATAQDKKTQSSNLKILRCVC